MTFRADRRIAGSLLVVALLNATVAALAFWRHSGQWAWGLLQVCLWLTMFALWLTRFTTRWTFEEASLVQTQLGVFRLCIPYADIVSVDLPGKRRMATIVYGGRLLFTQPSTLHVQPRDMRSFLAEMERRIGPALVHAGEHAIISKDGCRIA